MLMLKHQGAPRQANGASGKRYCLILPVDPGEADVHPGILVPLQVHAAGDGRRHIDPCGVENLPAELVLAPVEVVVVGLLRLRVAASCAFELRAVLPPRPVVVVDVPGPGLLDPRLLRGSTAAAPDMDPRLAAELELAV